MATLSQRLLDWVASVGADIKNLNGHTVRAYFYDPTKFPETSGWEVPATTDKHRQMISVRYPDAPDPGSIPAVAARLTINDEWIFYVPV